MKLFSKRSFGEWIEFLGDSLVGLGTAIGAILISGLELSWAVVAVLIGSGFVTMVVGAVIHAATKKEI